MEKRVLVVERDDVADGHPRWRTCLADLDVMIAIDGDTARRAVRGWCPDLAIVVTDVLVPADIDLMCDLARNPARAAFPLLLMSDCDDTDLLAAGVRAGVRGLLHHEVSPGVLRLAVDSLLDGRGYLGPEAADRLLEYVAAGGEPVSPPPAERDNQLMKDAAAIPLLLDALSERVARHLDRLVPRPPPIPGPRRPTSDLAAISRPAGDPVTLPMWLADAAHRAAVSRHLPSAFVQLRDHPTLSSTLARWLINDCDVRRAATSMYVHPNTVRYRLARVEEITQQSLSEMPVLTTLYLTVLASPATLGLLPETVDLIRASTRP
jgi:DNA-binding NarL/FixJ family response regulator